MHSSFYLTSFNKKKISEREKAVFSVRGVADFAELFANDRISGAEKEKD